MASHAHILRFDGVALNSFLLFVGSIGVSVYGGAAETAASLHSLMIYG